MEEMRIAALVMFLCGLAIGFIFGIMCRPSGNNEELEPSSPSRRLSGYQPLKSERTKENPPQKNR